MTKPHLANAPLGEAIFEIRWSIGTPVSDEVLFGGQPAAVDPHTGLLPGILFNHLKADYPVDVALPTAALPDMIAPFVARRQFRVSATGWPLVQVGPGFLTVNDTENYSWEKFKPRIDAISGALFELHPSKESLRVAALSLRYLNSVPFHFATENYQDFLADNLGVDLEISAPSLETMSSRMNRAGLDTRMTFLCDNPDGKLSIRLVEGKRDQEEALVWELSLLSSGPTTPNTAESINQWAEDAHTVLEELFFEMLDPKTLERFK